MYAVNEELTQQIHGFCRAPRMIANREGGAIAIYFFSILVFVVVAGKKDNSFCGKCNCDQARNMTLSSKGSARSSGTV